MNREQMLQKLKNALERERFEHTLRVECCAVELAQRIGCDKAKISTAALLHDCAKEYGIEQGLALAARYGVELDEYQRSQRSLLHAPLGAGVARIEYGVTDMAVLNAIEFHTTGRKNMSVEEKIIYIADAVESGRHFSGVQVLRNLCRKDLDSAMRYALKNGIIGLIRGGHIVHPDSIKALNSLIQPQTGGTYKEF